MATLIVSESCTRANKRARLRFSASGPLGGLAVGGLLGYSTPGLALRLCLGEAYGHTSIRTSSRPRSSGQRLAEAGVGGARRSKRADRRLRPARAAGRNGEDLRHDGCVGGDGGPRASRNRGRRAALRQHRRLGAAASCGGLEQRPPVVDRLWAGRSCAGPLRTAGSLGAGAHSNAADAFHHRLGFAAAVRAMSKEAAGGLLLSWGNWLGPGSPERSRRPGSRWALRSGKIEERASSGEVIGEHE